MSDSQAPSFRTKAGKISRVEVNHGTLLRLAEEISTRMNRFISRRNIDKKFIHFRDRKNQRIKLFILFKWKYAKLISYKFIQFIHLELQKIIIQQSHVQIK